MDYPEPTLITHVRFISRTANNMIVIDNTYKLYYYDNGWIYHSKQTPKYNFLIFDKVPSGTIYWLRNITTGNEELPFFYREDKQVFVNFDFPKL